MNTAEEARFQDLLAWGRQHGTTLHDSVEVYKDESTGYSLRAKLSAPASPPSDAGIPVVTCPATTTLSYLNALTGGPLPPSISSSTRLSPSFPPSFLSSLPPHVVGRFYLIQQYLLGPTSFWHPYIATLPQPSHLASWALPAFWPEDDVEFLEGTNAEVALREVQANVKAEFKLARRTLKEVGFPGWQDYSRLLYNWAFCIFTSRSFRPHTVASAGLRAQLRESGIMPEGRTEYDFSVLVPIMDIGNHDLRAKVTWDTESVPGVCRFVSRDGMRPGEQVFNNYGMKTNSELLLGYGFIIPETEGLHNDYVHLRLRYPTEEADGVAGGGDAGSEPELTSREPLDYVISLRPMLHPSSVVGRSRLHLRPEKNGNLEVLPALAHFEDEMIMDLLLAQAGVDQEVGQAVLELIHEASRVEEGQDHIMRRILASPTDPELEGVVAKTRDALLEKIEFDYHRMLDPEEYEGGEPALVPQQGNRNQELASAYRRRCKDVLEAVITSMEARIAGQ